MEKSATCVRSLSHFFPTAIGTCTPETVYG
jgi:hypothetical protein